MSMYYILNDEKKPIQVDVLTWGKWFEDFENNRRVMQTEFNGYEISTVFLGLNHQFGNGPPLIFETMIFDRDAESPSIDHYCERYTTWVQACEGHWEAVRYLKEALGIPADEEVKNGNGTSKARDSSE